MIRLPPIGVVNMAALMLCLVCCTSPLPQPDSNEGMTSHAEAEGDATTLRFVWLGDITPIWHPAAYQTFSQACVPRRT